MNSKTYLKNSTKPLLPFTAASFCVAWNRSPFIRSPFSVKYHPDHLGSSSWITDSGGHAIQHLQYLPFGETRVDQRTTSWSSRYSFSAKEKDEESGFSYFGARYYDSDLSIWLSVDPLASKYPNLSPYAYVANNPVKLVDPNGMEIEDGVGIPPSFRGCLFNNSESSQKNTRKNKSKTTTAIPTFDVSKNPPAESKSQATETASQASIAGTVTSLVVDFAADASKADVAASGMKEAADVAAAGDKFLNGMKVGAKWLGRVAGLVGVAASGIQLKNADSFEGKAEAGLDVFMNTVGLIPGAGTGVSLFWNLGGKTLHKNYVEKVLTPQAEMGIIGLPSVQPFK